MSVVAMTDMAWLYRMYAVRVICCAFMALASVGLLPPWPINRWLFPAVSWFEVVVLIVAVRGQLTVVVLSVPVQKIHCYCFLLNVLGIGL